MFRAMLLLIGVSALSFLNLSCLRNRLQTEDDGFLNQPAMPKPNFGRTGEPIGQTGLDPRSREIEASLGVEGDPPRFFHR